MNQRLGFSVGADRWCTGRYRFADTMHVEAMACPDRALAGQSDQCARCFRQDEFRFAHQFHQDPKTIQFRGRDALLRLRMDFLLLLPHGRRVVLEVDGKHHYSRNDRADPALYAQNMRADRDLKLSNYEVFRFGADELRTEEQAHATAEHFFRDLFDSFGVSPRWSR